MNPRARMLPHLPLALLLAVIAWLNAKGLNDPDVGWPDADRILMDGLFLHDLFVDIPFADLFSLDAPRRLYQYALGYFAQYPALSLGSRPPFFPAVEAAFFALFGVRDFSAKLAIIAFALLGAAAWHDLVRRTHDRATAFLATALLFTTPFIVQWGWYTMLEIPVLAMALVTTNLFWRYAVSGRAGWLYATAVSLALTLWTKQSALFLAGWFAVWLLVTGQFRGVLRQRATWGAAALFALLTLPLAALTIWMGRMNLALAFQGVDPALAGLGWSDWTYLRQYLDLLVQVQITRPLLALAAAGVAFALWRRDGNALFYLLLIAATYLFFTAMRSYRIDRYTIFWVPAFALLAALPAHHLASRPTLGRLAQLLTLALALWQGGESLAKTPAHTRGYQEAARIAMQHSRQGRIFMDGANNGYFTCFVRLGDPERRFFVLRGDKLLHSSAIFADSWTEVHVQDVAGIRAHFDRLGIDIVVVEERDYANLEIHRKLRAFLQTGPFEEVGVVPVVTTRTPLMGQSLRIYRYLEAKPPTAREITLSVPLVGMTFTAPMTTPASDAKKP